MWWVIIQSINSLKRTFIQLILFLLSRIYRKAVRFILIWVYLIKSIIIFISKIGIPFSLVWILLLITFKIKRLRLSVNVFCHKLHEILLREFCAINLSIFMECYLIEITIGFHRFFGLKWRHILLARIHRWVNFNIRLFLPIIVFNWALNRFIGLPNRLLLFYLRYLIINYVFLEHITQI